VATLRGAAVTLAPRVVPGMPWKKDHAASRPSHTASVVCSKLGHANCMRLKLSVTHQAPQLAQPIRDRVVQHTHLADVNLRLLARSHDPEDPLVPSACKSGLQVVP
jgi:hypothetical protein